MIVCSLLSGVLSIAAGLAGLMLLVTRQRAARRNLLLFIGAALLGAWLLPALCDAGTAPPAPARAR